MTLRGVEHFVDSHSPSILCCSRIFALVWGQVLCLLLAAVEALLSKAKLQQTGKAMFLTPAPNLQEIAEELGHHRAKEYNVGEMGRDTGVRYEDVAGIEHVKQDITDTMEMLTNKNPEFEGMGARPPRVWFFPEVPNTVVCLLEPPACSHHVDAQSMQQPLSSSGMNRLAFSISPLPVACTSPVFGMLGRQADVRKPALKDSV